MKRIVLYLLLTIGFICQTTLAWSANDFKSLNKVVPTLPVDPSLKEVTPPQPMKVLPEPMTVTPPKPMKVLPEPMTVTPPYMPEAPEMLPEQSPEKTKAGDGGTRGGHGSSHYVPKTKCFKLICCHTKNGIICHPEKSSHKHQKSHSKN